MSGNNTHKEICSGDGHKNKLFELPNLLFTYKITSPLSVYHITLVFEVFTQQDTNTNKP